MQPELHPDEIDAAPTKALFVDMLTRDIDIDHAVLDLIDNCIDGARNLRPGANANLAGLEIRISLDADDFTIVDNCGGISPEVARSYAFRFGRPANAPGTPHSIGRFGVG